MASLGLDLVGGARLAGAEMYGDWYRDPWGWPELAQEAVCNVDPQEDLGVKVGESGQFGLGLGPSFHLLDVPKTRLGARPAVVQDAVSRLLYLSAVHSGLARLHSGLADWVFGWRIRGDDGEFSSQGEWAAYVATLPHRDQDGFGLVTDITSCFASIRPERIEQVVFARLGKVAASGVIMDVIRAHDGLFTRSGLPQRSFASAALAHAALEPIDDALHAAEAKEDIVSVRRWMDDISAEGDEGQLFSLLVGLQERARQAGLELNSSKTHLSPVSATAANLRLEDLREIRVPITVVGGAYEDTRFEPDLDALHRLEDAVLEHPHEISRTIARAVLVSLTNNGQFSRYLEWLDRARYLPHAADSLGRYLRAVGEEDSTAWDFLGSWFSEYQASPWGNLDWVSSQYGLLFPATELPARVMSVLRHWLERSTNLQQVAVAVQRVCTVDPISGRDIIRARLDRAPDPLLLRVFALGLLLAEEARGTVESVLARDPRNLLLHRRLAETNWRVPSVAKDFDVSSAASDHD